MTRVHDCNDDCPGCEVCGPLPACLCHPMNLYDQNHLDPRCPFYSGVSTSEGVTDCEHVAAGLCNDCMRDTIDTGMGDREHIDDVYTKEGAALYRAQQERDGSIHAPDDHFYRERLRRETLITGPLERADRELRGVGGSYNNMFKMAEDARAQVGEAYAEVIKLMDLCETMSRGIIREHARRKAAEYKLRKIKETLDDQ